MAEHPILVPKASQAMTEATVSLWLVADGTAVAAGEAIYRLETDKVEMDVESPAAGTLRITGVEGETYPVGTQIGTIES